VQSDQNKLTAETIYINACGKYRDMNVMASRTLLVNPDETQKQTYIIANEALEVLMKNLVVGEPVKKAYSATKEFLKSKDAQLAGKTHTNFGFGVSNIKIH
jgi:nucleosome binding factor SPN SPT16 subunit